MSTLLPCPFCGAHRVTVASDSGERFVVCECCDAESGRWSDADRAIEDWNTRPIESALRSRVEGLEGAAERLRACMLHADWSNEVINDFLSMFDAEMEDALQPDKGERCGTCGGKRILPTRSDWPNGRSPCVIPCPDCQEAP